MSDEDLTQDEQDLREYCRVSARLLEHLWRTEILPQIRDPEAKAYYEKMLPFKVVASLTSDAKPHVDDKHQNRQFRKLKP